MKINFTKRTEIGIPLKRMHYDDENDYSQTWIFWYVDQDRLHPFQAQNITLECFYNVKLILN